MKKCSELENNIPVVFKIYSDIYKEKIYETGNVIYVLPNIKEVCVCYLKGFKSLTENIPYEDMVACYDENGETMSFDKLKGKMVEQHISQEKMAKMLGITIQSLNAKLNGRSHFTLEQVIKITDILSIKDPVDIFFTPSVPKMQRNKMEVV